MNSLQDNIGPIEEEKSNMVSNESMRSQSDRALSQYLQIKSGEFVKMSEHQNSPVKIFAERDMEPHT